MNTETEPATQHAVQVNLVVKASSGNEAVKYAEQELAARLNEWIMADQLTNGGFPDGALLIWSIVDPNRAE